MARRRTITTPFTGGGGGSDDDSGGGSDDGGSSGGGSSGGGGGGGDSGGGGGGSSSVGSVTRDRGGAGAGGGGEPTAGLGAGDDDSDSGGGGSPGGSTPPPTDVGGPSDPVPNPGPGPAPDDTASPPADVGGPATGADSGGSVGPSRQGRDDRTDGDAGASIEVPAGDDSGDGGPGGSSPPASDVGGPDSEATTPNQPAQPQGSDGQSTAPDPGPGPTTPGGLGDATPAQDAAEAVADADRDAEIVDELTSGGVLSERGESGGVLPDEVSANTPEGTATVDVSETRAREFAIAAQEFGDDIDAGAVFGSAADPLGSGGTVTESRAPASGDPANENPAEEFIEGGARIGTDLPAGITQTETAVEVATNAPGEIRDEGTGDVGETGVAVGRDIAARTAQQAAENPAEFSGGVAAGLLVGAGAGARGTGSLSDAIRAEVDPRVGPLGTTAETQAIRGLRDRLSSDDDTGGLTPDDDLGSGGSGPLLDTETVDAERGVSDPSVTTQLRGDAERAGRSIAADINDRLTDIRDRAGGTDRGQLQLGGQRPDTDGGGGSPSSFDDFDGTRREDILEGSPRDRMSDEIADRTQAQRRQFSGDVEQPFTERGDGTRTPADRATFDPDSDTDSGPVAEAVARRQDAEQRFDRRGNGRRDGDATDVGAVLGALGGGVGAGLLGTPDSDTAPGLLDRPRFDVGGRPDVDTTPDVDVFTDFDFGQDIGSDTDTGGDLDTDTDTDLPDPDLTDPVRDPPTDTPRDPPRDTPGDPPTDRRRDPPRPFDPEDDNSDSEAALFVSRSLDDLIDSGIQSGSEAASDLFDGR